MHTIVEIIRVDLALYFRNKIALFWTILFPFLLLVVLTGTFGEGKGRFGVVLVAIDDQDRTSESRSYVASLDRSLRPIQSIEFHVIDRVSADDASANSVTLTIPEGFGERVLQHQPVKLMGFVRGDNSYLLSTAASIVSAANDRLNITRARSPELVSLKLEAAPTKEALTYTQFIVAGIIVMASFSTCLFGFTVPIVSFRDQGFLKIVGALPIGIVPFVIGFVASRVVIIVVYAGIFLLGAKLIYGIELAASPSAWISSCALFAAGVIMFLTFGFAVAAVSPSVSAATILCNVIYFSSTFSGNLFFSAQTLPKSISSVLSMAPLNALVGALRGSLFHGDTLSECGPVILSLLGWTLAALMVSIIARRVRTPLQVMSKSKRLRWRAT